MQLIRVIIIIFKMSENKKKLIELEKTEKYVFHGSSDKLDELEPRQGFNFSKKLNKMVKDGEPAVSAAPYVEIAIFRAIINNDNAPKNHKSGFGYSNEELSFRASQETLNQVKNKKGFIYVLDRNEFTRVPGMFWRADHIIKPIEIIQVDFNDLPEKIDIINEL